VLLTGGVLVVSQLPNLLMRFVTNHATMQTQQEQVQKMTDAMAELDQDFEGRKIDITQYQQRQREVTETYVKEAQAADAERTEQLSRNLLLANRVLPIGWLPLGIMGTAEGNVLPTIFGGLGMAFLGVASLWRAYRTTLRLYQGQFTAERKPAKLAQQPSPTAIRYRSSLLGLETRVPGLSAPAAVISLAGLRSILRAPEGKMMLITPILIGALYGFSVARWPDSVPLSVRPLIGFGAIVMALFGMMQIMCNQFGFDRDGFRVFVLCPARRRDILLGKNLAFAPLTFGITVVMLIMLQFILPMRVSHFLAMLPQAGTMFLLFCLLMNMVSMYAPMAIASGSLKPTKPRIVPILLQVLVVFVFLPLSQLPTLLPLGVEVLLEYQGHTVHLPVFLLLSILQFGLIVLLYRLVLSWQGRLLEEREQQILETVTGRAN
jgi:ABC-2 type transport system permease protein